MIFDRADFDDIFLAVHGAFLGWITDTMQAAYINLISPSELELLVFYSKDPSNLDLKIMEEEILFSIEDSVINNGIQKVSSKGIVLEGTMANFKSSNNGYLDNYWPVFIKYEFMDCDLLD